MPDRQIIEDFLAQDHLAFVGVSRDTKQFANSVYRRLRDGGRVLYPVNPVAHGEPLETDKSYERLADVPDPVDGVIVMVPAAVAVEVVNEAAARGIPRVWLYRGVGAGAMSAEAVQALRRTRPRSSGRPCPLMFEHPVRGVH
jgi:predicted CoA-binding protein